MDDKTREHIIAALRRASLTWSGRQRCLEKFRRRVKTTKVLMYSKFKDKNFTLKEKWEHQCQICMEWFDISFIEVDHIVEVGTFKNGFDEPIGRLFDEDNLQTLCCTCHLEKTKGFMAVKDFKRKS
jgi:5-methylcytosine-specific restriction endonuclease McrA